MSSNEEPVQYKEFFLDWCSHFVERTVRLRQYLSDREVSVPSGSRSPDVIKDLLEWNDELAKTLYDISSTLLAHKEDEIERLWFGYFSKLRVNIPQKYRALHAYLSFMPTPWPGPELGLFVSNVLKAAQYKGSLPLDEPTWTILLTGEYNFSDTMVPILPLLGDRRMVSEVKESSFTALPALFRNAITIPAVEKDNPCAWPNLVHELGHYIGEVDGIISKAKSLSIVQRWPEGKRGTVRELWIPEIVADLIATDLLGIGYYTNFIMFATYWTEKSLRLPSDTHPSIEARRRCIYQRLKDLGKIAPALKNSLDAEYVIRQNLESKAIELAQPVYDKIQDESRKFPGYDWQTELEQLQELAGGISLLDDYKKLFKSPGGSSDVALLERLAGKLAEDELVSSRQEFDPEISKWSVEKIQANLEQAKFKLVHVPNDIRDILTAAQLVEKLHKSHWARHELLTRFCRKFDASKVRDQLTRLWSFVHKRDIVVTKSIEGSEIARFYQTSKAYEKESEQWKAY